MPVIIEEISATVVPPEPPAEERPREAPPAPGIDLNKLRALLLREAERARRVRAD